MAFTGVSAMDLKREFVELAQAEDANVRELCRRYGISANLAYRLMERWRVEGEAGLAERSRRPLRSPSRTPETVEAMVLAIRAEHPAWGGRKIAAVLRRRGVSAPAASTVSDILRRHGVALGVNGGGKPAFIRFEHPRPNDLWQMDFKGHVAMRAGRLHPLTVLDDHSRFAVVLGACADERTATVQGWLHQAFSRYGLPWRMTMDNGAPWGNGAGDPYTPLIVWLMEQDIAVSHSRPYHPQTQGKDERFHRSLKAEVLGAPPFEDLEHAAQALARWRSVYNTERPHEAIGLDVPIDRYQASPRAFKETIEPFAYGPDDQLRRVASSGRLSFANRRWRVPKAFKGKHLALRPTQNDGVYDILFRTQHLATIDITINCSDPEGVTDVPAHLSRMSPV